MKEVLIYLLKSGLCLSLFLLIYRLFMRSTTFFKLNRAFLISGLIIALVIPAISFTYNVVIASYPTVMQVDSESLKETPIVSKVSEVSVDYSSKAPVVTQKASNVLMIKLDTVWMVLFIIYIIVVVLLLVREFMTNSKLRSMLKGGKKTKYEGYTVIDTPKALTPFTTFNVIFADMGKISDDEAKTSILKHEIVHIKQRHWIDLVFAELALILQWFNPVMWMYVRQMKGNHEYLADKGVLEQGISLATYRAALVNERLQGDAFNIANSFKGGNSLGRLAMMKKKTTAKWKRALTLAIFPLLGLFLWASAEPNYLLFDLNNLSVKLIDDVNTVDENGYPAEGGISMQDILAISYMPSYDAIIPSSLRTAKLDLYAKLGTEGTLVVKTGKNSNGVSHSELIERVRSLKDIVILIDGEAASMEDLLEVSPQGIASLSYIINNKMISQEGEKITASLISGYDSAPRLVKTDDLDIAISDMDEMLTKLDNPLVILNGKIVEISKLKQIKPKNINVMSVFTKQKNTNKYGEKGKGGVLIITTTDVPS